MASEAQIDLVHKSISSGFFGHIQWKHSAADLVRRDPDLQGLTPEGIRELLRQFVLAGNKLQSRIETRQEYLEENPDDPFWYRALIAVAGIDQELFVEVRLIDDDADQPWVEIVSAHL